MYEFEEFVQILRNECVDFLNNIFDKRIVSLQEVSEEIIKYCNASGLPRDGNVYLLVFPSGKRYCGQTVNLERRVSMYKSFTGSNPHITSALKLYTFENVDIYHVQIPRICMDFTEVFMIKNYNLMDPDVGYNKDSGGTSGYTFSEEIKIKMSVSRTGRFTGESHHMWGKKHTEETLQKMRQNSARLVGSKNGMFGKSHTEETKTKVARVGEANHMFRNGWKIKGDKNPNFGNGDKIRGDKNPMYGKRHKDCTKEILTELSSKPVFANGKVYSSAQTASLDIKDNKYFVSRFIKSHPKSEEIFYISRYFYKYIENNNLSHITRMMSDDYLYFI